jgi:hypothetical protein
VEKWFDHGHPSHSEADQFNHQRRQRLLSTCDLEVKRSSKPKILELFNPPPPPTFFPQINRDPPPVFLGASKFAREARIKICARTFETCRSSDVYNYMIFYIIIGHRSNEIQILFYIDDFFSFFSPKNTNLLINLIYVCYLGLQKQWYVVLLCGERRVKKHCFHEWGRKKSRVAKATSGFWSPHKWK